MTCLVYKENIVYLKQSMALRIALKPFPRHFNFFSMILLNGRKFMVGLGGSRMLCGNGTTSLVHII